MWFTDPSPHPVGSRGQNEAAAHETGTGKTITEEGEGSAQVGELRAFLVAAENGATIIYTDP